MNPAHRTPSLLLLPFFLASASLALAQPAAIARSTNSPVRARVADAPEVRDALVELDVWLEGQRLNSIAG